MGNSDKQTLEGKVVTLSFVFVESVPRSSVYNSLALELASASHRDYTLRVLTPLDEDFLTDSKKSTRKMLCDLGGAVTLQYYKGVRSWKGLEAARADAQERIDLSGVGWEDKGTHMLAARSIALGDLRLQVSLRLLKMDAKEEEESGYAEAHPPTDTSLQRPIKLRIARIELKKCFLFEILEKGQMYWMLRDSEETLSFTGCTSSRDYVWECSLPVVCSKRTEHSLVLMLLDRNSNFGEPQLSELENSQVMKFTLRLDTLSSQCGEIRLEESAYFEQFLKYAKKYSLVNPQTTKHFNDMVGFHPPELRVAYRDMEVCEFGQGLLHIANAKFLKEKEDLALKSLQLEVDGHCLTFGPVPANKWMAEQAWPVSVSDSRDARARVTVFLEEHNKSTVAYELNTTASQLLPMLGRRSKATLALSADEQLAIYYSSSMEKPLELPLTSNCRVARPAANFYKVRLGEVTLEGGSCSSFLVECETENTKYRSRRYHSQMSGVRMHPNESFQLLFEDGEDAHSQPNTDKPGSE